MSLTIDNGVEYALYAIAIDHPFILKEAERFTGGMIANNQVAAQRVKDLLDKNKPPVPSTEGLRLHAGRRAC